MSKDTGGPAFPGAEPEFIDHPVHGYTIRTSVGMEAHPGMTLRDYFAAAALPGVLQVCSSNDREPGESIQRTLARRSYELADAMLAERAKDGEA